MRLTRAAAAVCSLYFIWGQDALLAQPPAAVVFDPESLQLVGVTLMPVAGRSHIAVGVGNRTERTLWLRITVEAGQPVLCEGERVPLRAAQIAWFRCPVNPIVQGRPYPLRIEVFREQRDEASIGATQARPVFTLRDVLWLQSQLKP